MQYMIYLTNGKEETCCVISEKKQNATDTFYIMQGFVKREDAWLELREYTSHDTQEYIVLKKQEGVFPYGS